MLDSGLVYMWRERSLQSLDTCSRRDESQDNNARPLDLQDVQVGSLLFLYEIFIHQTDIFSG